MIVVLMHQSIRRAHHDATADRTAPRVALRRAAPPRSRLYDLVAYPAFTQPVIDKGAPVKWRLIDPALFTALTLNLSKNAPRPNAGKLYIDFLLSDEGQELLAANRQIPALPSKIPPVYASIGSTKLVPQAHELETERFDFFQQKMKEFFVR